MSVPSQIDVLCPLDFVAASQPNAVAAEIVTPAQRVYGLEWLRAGLTIAVLAFHAAVAYTLVPLPGLNWAIHDPAGCPFADVCCWALNGFIMPTFFLLAGFCSARIFVREGASRFIQQRTRRLLPALVFGTFVILPITAYSWFLSWAAQGFMPLEKLWKWGIPDSLEENLYGMGHLWFVQYLWVFCLIVWGTSRSVGYLGDRSVVRLHRLQERLMNSFWLPFFFAIPAGCVLAIEPRIVIGFRQAILPQLANVAYYLPCFAAGFWLRRCERRGITLVKWCEFRAVLAIVVFALMLPLVRMHLLYGLISRDRFVMAGLFGLYGWLAATSLFGLSIKYLQRPAPAIVKYVASSSLWTYLIHVPFVGLLQLSLQRFELPLMIKFLLVTSIGLLLSLATYRVLVERTWIGRLLEPSTPARRTFPNLVEVAPPEQAATLASA